MLRFGNTSTGIRANATRPNKAVINAATMIVCGLRSEKLGMVRGRRLDPALDRTERPSDQRAGSVPRARSAFLRIDRLWHVQIATTPVQNFTSLGRGHGY